MKLLTHSLFVAAVLICQSGIVWAVSVDIKTPIGDITVDISHASTAGQLVEPKDPTGAGFRPPTIFSAPLPTGSGARALGQAGAFTAVADDATAASWNPAGLTQLEYAEMSVVYRFSSQEDQHHSSSRDLTSGADRYSNDELNYASAVYPFLLNGQNAVFSMNFQEAYDFNQSFTAQFAGSTQQDISAADNQTFYESTTNRNSLGVNTVAITRTTTEVESEINQLLQSSLLSDISFFQQGTIDAFSPAFAVDLTPRLSVGIAVNIYVDGAARGNAIRSSLAAGYTGASESYTEGTNTYNSSSMITVTGIQYVGPPYNQVEQPFSETAGPITFSDTELYTNESTYGVTGMYWEENRTEQFYGFNATLGALWAASDRLTLGASVDLPWTGRGKQTKSIQHQVTTFNSNGVQVAQNYYNATDKRDVEYTFPLYWAVGALWRWNDRFYSSLDASRTYWSDYSYKAEGEERINPLNGESYSSSNSDDCWSLRFGSEYLCVLSWTEIPLRGGLFWEQRPATGSPDEYWGVTLGSGISLGKEPGRLILDVAYSFECANDVMGSLIPGQGMTSDVSKHQLFVSAIWHF
ncbi:porin family protein [Tichowtungia aerotolerans]|uniref:Uncharacterized protein n=1 Tax=Tichowtungia aerotolerans TaxID=2697043 RepID=A0A6P1MBW1_9BACT|nr:outer membrane protein transport protein [Tichowtungia aerotolerans]QHI69066.1 hypothetical protein GT409_06275 [Tichowtungia aerotolerans]